MAEATAPEKVKEKPADKAAETKTETKAAAKNGNGKAKGNGKKATGNGKKAEKPKREMRATIAKMSLAERRDALPEDWRKVYDAIPEDKEVTIGDLLDKWGGERRRLGHALREMRRRSLLTGGRGTFKRKAIKAS